MTVLALVVDDSMLIRHTVCRLLEKRGFLVSTATDGHEALEALKTFRPHVILTDLQMPRLAGHQLIAALKARPETASIPIIVLAAKPSAHEQIETGADAVVYKDFNIDVQLAKALEVLLPNPDLLASSQSQ